MSVTRIVKKKQGLKKKKDLSNVARAAKLKKEKTRAKNKVASLSRKKNRSK